MTLETFITTNKIILDKTSNQLCTDGLNIMKQSIDPLHDEKHIERILNFLDSLLKNAVEFKAGEVNFNALLPAIFWHDTWKSTRMPTNSVTVLFDQVWDGIGSRLKFRKFLSENYPQLDKTLRHEISYIIRKHGKIQFIERKTLEAKIMNDVDRLDEWSIERLEALKNKFLDPKSASKVNLSAGKFYLKYFLERKTPKHFYFEWSKNEFLSRRDVILNTIYEGIAEYEKLLNAE